MIPADLNKYWGEGMSKSQAVKEAEAQIAALKAELKEWQKHAATNLECVVRLQALLASHNLDEREVTGRGLHESRVSTLENQNKKLRLALEKIQSITDSYFDEYGNGPIEFTEIQHYATRALSDGGAE